LIDSSPIALIRAAMKRGDIEVGSPVCGRPWLCATTLRGRLPWRFCENAGKDTLASTPANAPTAQKKPRRLPAGV